METYRITDSDGSTLHEFEARQQGEAVHLANLFDEQNGLSNTKLWVKQHDGSWIAY